MAKATKAARHISVQDVRYRWRATGNDNFISVCVWPETLPGAAIVCSVGYHQTRVFRPGLDGVGLRDQIVVTNRIVRRVIEHAIRDRAYDPHVKAKQLDLRCIDEKISLAGAVRAD
jgi:hypothetical protein